MKILRTITALFIAFLLTFSVAAAAPDTAFDLNCKSAVLMEASTGTVLYEKNADEPLPPASVTKIMTLLLIMEAIDGGSISLDDSVQVSERAASMGGSQVFLEPGESMAAEELIKCIVIASANDAALTMAEAVAGSEESFVSRMNERARELGMKNTNFENVTGLDDNTTSHVTSARDIALMSRELMKHEKIFEFSTVWMDSIRNGEFGLTNTNRLIRFYKGATGLKTGSTSKAGFCISATAKRDGMHLIAVIMGAESRDKRNEAAKTLLDYGFANYSVYGNKSGSVGKIRVTAGVKKSVEGLYNEKKLLTGKGRDKKITVEYLPDESVSAPVHKGDLVGKVRYLDDGKVLCEDDILAADDVEKIGFFGIFRKMLGGFLLN